MRNYTKVRLSIILTVSILLSSSLSTLADTYSLGIKQGDSFIYEIKTFNKEKVEEVGFNYIPYVGQDTQVGYKKCYSIASISEYSDSWIVYFNIWPWKADDNRFYFDPLTTTYKTLQTDPTKYTANLKISHFQYIDSSSIELFTLFPLNLNAYLAAVDWHDNYTLSDKKITYTSGNKQYEYTYSETGVLNAFTVKSSSITLLSIQYIGSLYPNLFIKYILSPIGLLLIFGGILAVVLVIFLLVRKKRNSQERVGLNKQLRKARRKYE